MWSPRIDSTGEVPYVLPAQLFFKSLGFLAIRVLRGYYEDSGEDAFLMQYRIADDTGEETDGAVNRIAQYEEN